MIVREAGMTRAQAQLITQRKPLRQTATEQEATQRESGLRLPDQKWDACADLPSTVLSESISAG